MSPPVSTVRSKGHVGVGTGTPSPCGIERSRHSSLRPEAQLFFALLESQLWPSLEQPNQLCEPKQYDERAEYLHQWAKLSDPRFVGVWIFAYADNA